jgi:hypothetical protein
MHENRASHYVCLANTFGCQISLAFSLPASLLHFGSFKRSRSWSTLPEMEVVSHSPLPVASVLWQPRPSVWVLTYVTKATFQLEPGKSTLASTQLPIREEDSHWDDDPARSLYAASDLEPFKPRVDVLVVGSAFAPQAQPVRSLFARLALGEIDKSIEVFLDRSLNSENVLLDGQRFSRMSLAYERAAGGPDTTNPVGVRLDQRDAYGRLKLPNLQPVGVNDLTAVMSMPPVGFGPVAPRWPVRWAKLGRHASSWSRQWLKAGPVPEDFDWSFFNAAPHDQQLPELAEDTRLILENLHPEIPRLVTSFPSLRPRVVAERRAGHQPHKMRCDMLWIDTDKGIATMTFRGQIALESLDEPGRVVITLEESAREATSPSSSGSPRSEPSKVAPIAPPPRSRPTTRTLMISPDDEGIDTLSPATGIVKITAQKVSALPFASKAMTSSQPQPIVDEPSHSGGGLPFAVATPPSRDERSRNTPTAGLPFVQTGSWPAPTVGVPITQAPAHAPVHPAPPPIPAVRPPMPGRIAPPSPAVPRVPQSVTDVPPPLPINVVAPPPLPVRPASSSAPQQSATDSSVWSAPPAPVTRPEPVVGGQTMGQLAAAAAATAALAPTQDGSTGVLGASNAAANTSGLSKRDDKPSGAGSSAGGLNALNTGVRASSKFDAREVLHLIWYQPDSVARICKVPVWRTIITEMEGHPADDDLDDPAPNKDPIEIEDTRDIFEILVRASSQDVDQLGDELQSAVRPGGKFVPSLLLLAGELVFPFEERETLKATVATVAPMVGTDEVLKTAIKDARDFLASPDQICPGTVIEGYTTRIREAYQRARRSIAFDQLEVQIERVLLEGRCYQKRQVLGMNTIRALLGTGTGSSSVRPAPVYLPEDLAKKLPLFQKFRTRVIVELYMQEDQYEQHPAALKALALGRIQVPPDSKR